MKTVHSRPLVVRAFVVSLLGLALTCQLLAAEKAGPERWQKAIAAFEAADKANPPPQGAILFIGSSTIVRWKTLAQDFPEHPVINRGFGGSQIADSVFYADRIVIPYRPRLIVLRAGGNDIHAGKTPEQVAADFQAFVEKVRAKLPEVRIAYMTINATPSRWANVEREKKANQLIKEYIAAGKNLDYIDTFDATLGADGKPREELFVKDRLHFNDEGYKVLAAIVRKHLPEPAEEAIRIEKDVEYLGPDRQEKGDLYLPAKVAEGQRCPAVVIIHGGGWSGGDKGAAREINIGTNLAHERLRRLQHQLRVGQGEAHLAAEPVRLQDGRALAAQERRPAARRPGPHRRHRRFGGRPSGGHGRPDRSGIGPRPGRPVRRILLPRAGGRRSLRTGRSDDLAPGSAQPGDVGRRPAPRSRSSIGSPRPAPMPTRTIRRS